MDAYQEKFNAWQNETTTCQEAKEAYTQRKLPTPVDMADITAHSGDCNEETRSS
jgi:hypothetical protein